MTPVDIGETDQYPETEKYLAQRSSDIRKSLQDSFCETRVQRGLSNNFVCEKDVAESTENKEKKKKDEVFNKFLSDYMIRRPGSEELEALISNKDQISDLDRKVVELRASRILDQVSVDQRRRAQERAAALPTWCSIKSERPENYRSCFTWSSGDTHGIRVFEN